MLRRTRRAPTACSWCHHRKVRCDASLLGCPCTRCRQDGRSDCTLRAKCPKPHVPPQRNKPPRSSKSQPSEALPFDQKPTRRAGVQATLPQRASSEIIELIQVTHSDFEDDFTRVPQNRPCVLHLDQCPFISLDGLASLAPEDITFIGSKGSLTVPEPGLARIFVNQFFKHIHPTIPVLDEAEFWKAFEGNGSDTLSPFIFQTVLFASCPFVPVDVLQRCGFVSKRDARIKLYDRSKILYDLKAETRPSAKAQGAILLTHHTSAEAPQAGSLWLSRAIEDAMMVDAQPTTNMDLMDGSMKKRLWWSILLRDRSLGIGLRRHPQVTSNILHGYPEWLREEDFQSEMHHSRVYNYTTKKLIFDAFHEQCQLAVLLTDLVSLPLILSMH
ncbi:hypothetical protein N7462_002909 [Penicillium macrosclerotiorum]|uniref:uncharacterized protein n=1 Tax=Penicillium macrosclerotiorum TaxID=303699 RepID=UPI00254966CC|nr:uncharacterized protein N7462_002909 [Penicillium macrosclerotiorum]KAJ5688517.1 hypothetical protein N7462_002909 [Penicillium macrosclerotiorum]